METKVSQWESKRAEVQEMGAEERIRMAEDTLRKAKAEVEEKENAIEALDRSVRRTELVLARAVDKVKKEEEDEVVEVDVEPEELMKGMVKEEEEAKVVVERPAGVGGGVSQWLGVMMGSRHAGPIQDLPWDPGYLAGPHPPNLDNPLLVAPESLVWTLRFLLQRLHHRLLGGGGVGMGARGGGGPPGQAPAPKGGQRVVGVARGVAGAAEEMGGGAPPNQKKWRGKMFELVQTNLFTPERKKGGGHPLAIGRQLLVGAGLGGMKYVGKAWTSTPTWSALMNMGGFNAEAAKRGAYAGLVHDIASRPKSKPKPTASPAGAPPQPHPPNPRDTFAKALGAISPTLGRQGTVC